MVCYYYTGTHSEYRLALWRAIATAVFAYRCCIHCCCMVIYAFRLMVDYYYIATHGKYQKLCVSFLTGLKIGIAIAIWRCHSE